MVKEGILKDPSKMQMVANLEPTYFSTDRLAYPLLFYWLQRVAWLLEALSNMGDSQSGIPLPFDELTHLRVVAFQATPRQTLDGEDPSAIQATLRLESAYPSSSPAINEPVHCFAGRMQVLDEKGP